MSLPQPQAWDRSIETRETPTAYRAFMDYCRMGTRRSLRALLEQYTQQAPNKHPTEKPPTVHWWTLCDWSKRHEWQRRVGYWDANQERLRTEQSNQVIADMNRRHAHIGMLGQQKGLAKLQSLLGTEITVNEATRLLDIATKIERVARGEPVTIETHQHGGPHGGPIPIREIVVIRPAKKRQFPKEQDDGDPDEEPSGETPSVET